MSEGPVPLRIGVRSMITVTYLSPRRTEELPDATAVMDPSSPVCAGTSTQCASPATRWTTAADACSRHIHGHRGRKAIRSTRARRTLHTGVDLLTDKQRERIRALFAADEHVEVEATWGSTSA